MQSLVAPMDLEAVVKYVMIGRNCMTCVGASAGSGPSFPGSLGIWLGVLP